MRKSAGAESVLKPVEWRTKANANENRGKAGGHCRHHQMDIRKGGTCKLRRAAIHSAGRPWERDGDVPRKRDHLEKKATLLGWLLVFSQHRSNSLQHSVSRDSGFLVSDSPCQTPL